MRKHEPKDEIMLGQLPKDCLQVILGFVPLEERFPLHLVCKSFHNALMQLDGTPHRSANRNRLQIKQIKLAATLGKLDMLKWLSNTLRWPVRFYINSTAAKNGQIEVLKWPNKIMDNPILCSKAAGGGQIKTLQWLRESGCPWNAQTCSFAARCGQLETLKWARKNGCPWDETVTYNAARYGHLNVLIWAKENGCLWDEQTCASAAIGGHIEILQWLREKKCPWNSTTLINATANGHLTLSQWIVANRQSPWTMNDYQGCCRAAARFGHLQILEWLLEAKGVYIDTSIIGGAILGSQIHVLSWLRDRVSDQWDSDVVCEQAYCNRKWEVIQWASEHCGCRCKYHSSGLIERGIQNGYVSYHF